MDLYSTAEQAIETFERIHGLHVTVHDLDGSLSPFLRSYRFHHNSPLCLAVKVHGYTPVCMRFEIDTLRREIANYPEGRVHICHANLVEWLVPNLQKGKLLWVLFAGPRFPGTRLHAELQEPRAVWLKPPWRPVEGMPKVVEDAESQLILEHLRQLAARLREWVRQSKSKRIEAGLATRQNVIYRFIENRYAEIVTLPMLAKILRLSESRTSHFVRQNCGASVRELLIRQRVRIAMQLLRQTTMSVLDVALGSGFEDVAHFHRLFRKRTGMTPRQYRVGGQV